VRTRAWRRVHQRPCLSSPVSADGAGRTSSPRCPYPEGRRALRSGGRCDGFSPSQHGKRRAAGISARAPPHRVLVFTADNETAYAIAREHLVMPLTWTISRPERDDVLERFRHGDLRRSCRRGAQRGPPTSLTPDVAVVLWVARSGSVSMCSEWVGCCGRARQACLGYSLLREIPLNCSVRRDGDARPMFVPDLLAIGGRNPVGASLPRGTWTPLALRVLLEEHNGSSAAARELEAPAARPTTVSRAPRGSSDLPSSSREAPADASGSRRCRPRARSARFRGGPHAHRPITSHLVHGRRISGA